MVGHMRTSHRRHELDVQASIWIVLSATEDTRVSFVDFSSCVANEESRVLFYSASTASTKTGHRWEIKTRLDLFPRDEKTQG
jgi:hypothetical protein